MPSLRSSLRLLSLALLLALLVDTAPLSAAPSQAALPTVSVSGQEGTIATALPQLRAIEGLRSAPAMFVENVGQFAAGARFLVLGGDRTLWLAEDALWVSLLEKPAEAAGPAVQEPDRGLGEAEARPRRGVHLKLSFVGANPHPRLEPFDRLETHVSYFIGSDPEKWRADVPVWGGVRYVDLYPGLDLVVTGEGGQLALRLRVQDAQRGAASLKQVRMRVEGADALRLEGGALRAQTLLGEEALPLLEGQGAGAVGGIVPGLVGDTVAAPYASEVPTRGVRGAETGAGLVYATFLGGAGWDVGHAIAVDGLGQAYLAGETQSPDFPATVGPGFDTSYGSVCDAYVAKLNPAGNWLEYATFLGGADCDMGHAIAVDDLGQAYVAGMTKSEDFPAAAGPGYDTSHNGEPGWPDAFVAKLNATGTALLYATFLGGSWNDWARAIAVDTLGQAYVAGWTECPNFPATAGPGYDGTYNGVRDAFVASLDRAGTGLRYATFLGGTDIDMAHAIAVDALGQAYVAGETESPDFPPAAGPGYDTSYNGSCDAFVLKLNDSGTALVYATYLGGAGLDGGAAIAVDGLGQAYVAGHAERADFVAAGPGYDTSYNGWGDAFVVKINVAGTGLLYATFLGGAGGSDFAHGVAVDRLGRAYVAGSTGSSDFPPAAGPGYDTSHNGGRDGFVTRLDAGGTRLEYGTFLGGTEEDVGRAIAVDALGQAYVAGETQYPGFPVAAGVGYDTTFNGVRDAFVVKLAMGPRIEITQAIQDEGNTVPLVAGKDTAVRAFLSAPVEVNAGTQRLVVKHDGTTLTTLYPKPSRETTAVLTFECSDRAACGQWQAGNYTFEVTADGATAQETASLQARRSLRILAVPVKVMDRGQIKRVPTEEWKTAQAFLERVYPLATGSVSWQLGNELDATPYDLTTSAGKQELWEALRRLQPPGCLSPGGAGPVPGPICYDKIVGFIPPMPICSSGCTLGWTWGAPANVVMANGTFTRTVGGDIQVWTIDDMEAIVAHEIGHNYGLGDEYNNLCGAFQCGINPPPASYRGREWRSSSCDNSYGCAGSTAMAWPGPGTGSMAPGDQERLYEVGGRGTLGDRLSFMGSGGRQSDCWVTHAIYGHLFDALAPLAQGAASLQSVAEALHVSGWMGQDGSVTLDPWYRITTTLGAPVTATYTIEAVDALSSTLASQGFEVSFLALENPPRAIDPAPFEAVVAFPAGTEALRIKQGEAVLRVVPVSAHAPTVALVEPTAGEVVSGTHAIIWQGDDADGDQLYYTVEYAHDGQEWIVLAGAITQTQTIADFASLAGGTQARIRVWASDGVNSTQALSGAFVVPAKSPQVFVESPAPGSCHVLGLNVVLRGSAYDPQEGFLESDTALAWTSDRDGFLGGGGLLNLHSLSAGGHTITLTATSSQGLTATASTHVYIAVPPEGVTVSGPLTGTVGVAYDFTATVTPATAELPLDYRWEATDYPLPVTHFDVNSTTDAAVFSWVAPGQQTIIVTVSNEAGVVMATHAIMIGARMFLPLILRN